MKGNEQNCNPFCLLCTWDLIRKAQEADPSFDPSDIEQLRTVLAYAEHSRQNTCTSCTGRDGHGQPLHASIEFPTECYACGRLHFFDGKIMMCCPSCNFSYVFPSESLKPTAALSSANAAKAHRQKICYYIRTFGGKSEVLGDVRDLDQAFEKLFRFARSSAAQQLDFLLTPRIVISSSLDASRFYK